MILNSSEREGRRGDGVTENLKHAIKSGTVATSVRSQNHGASITSTEYRSQVVVNESFLREIARHACTRETNGVCTEDR